MSRCRIASVATRPDGASLIDAIVGIAVAMIALVVVYQAFVATDAMRRNASAVADAQAAAAFALATIATQAGNAGAGWSAASRWLDDCPATASIATSLRPIPVLVADGGSADRPDSLVVRQTYAHALALPAAIAAPAPAGTRLQVESPDGFAVGDRVIAITRSGACAAATVTTLSPAVAGVVDVTHTGIGLDLPITTVLLDVGDAGLASTLRFDVASGALRSQDVANGDAPAPLVSNVVNLKFQYGIDSDGDGALDTWSPATGAWSAAAVLAAPRATLARIKAIRVGIIVRTDRVERTLGRDFHWVLFDCDDDDKSLCPGRLEGAIAAGPRGSYRYRLLEAVVPLRNVLWNGGA